MALNEARGDYGDINHTAHERALTSEVVSKCAEHADCRGAARPQGGCPTTQARRVHTRAHCDGTTPRCGGPAAGGPCVSCGPRSRLLVVREHCRVAPLGRTRGARHRNVAARVRARGRAVVRVVAGAARLAPRLARKVLAYRRQQLGLRLRPHGGDGVVAAALA